MEDKHGQILNINAIITYEKPKICFAECYTQSQQRKSTSSEKQRTTPDMKVAAKFKIL